MALGFTQPLTECFWGIKIGRRLRLTIPPPYVIRLSRKCEILDISQPYRSPLPVTGIALLFTLPAVFLYLEDCSKKIFEAENTLFALQGLVCEILGSYSVNQDFALVKCYNFYAEVGDRIIRNICVLLPNYKALSPNIHFSSQFIIALLEVLNYALKSDEMVPFRISSLVLS
jgi:hypothetical protein